MNTKVNFDALQRKSMQIENDLPEVHAQEIRLNHDSHGREIDHHKRISGERCIHAKKLTHYWRDARWSSYVTTPLIVSCIIPAALLDFWATVYQFICFPAYGIPKVRRRDYVILDRGKLHYLNSIKRLNCAYCGYVNGLLAYVQEIAARTEQHWCPIKHAFRIKTMHSRYKHFLNYGDAKQYREQFETVRRDFDDLKPLKS